MIGLLTWTTWGTWLGEPARGWIDRGGVLRGDDPGALPGPDEEASRKRRRGLKWPAAMLTADQRRLIIKDLRRIAELRRFELMGLAATENCVRVLLACDDDRDIERLVQLIKGALSRMLTVAAGDAPASSPGGGSLVHHKWWPRHYSFLRVGDQPAQKAIVETLRTGADAGATVWIAGSGGE
ncbi:MAG: transposase [Phycisphaerales bacterium]|nr:MAG: transposase [Phycisphaerales bacterium]